MDEGELRAYQTRYEMREDDKRDAGQSSTEPPPPTSHEEDDSNPSQPIEDQV